MSNSMKIRPIGAELLNANRQTDRQTDRQTYRRTDRETDVTKLIAPSRNFWNASKNTTSMTGYLLDEFWNRCGRKRPWPHLGYCAGSCLNELRQTTNTTDRLVDVLTEIQSGISHRSEMLLAGANYAVLQG
jgi:hypothetical protein